MPKQGPNQSLGSLWTRLPETLGPLVPLDAEAWAAVAHLPPDEQLCALGLDEEVMEICDRQGRTLGIGPLLLSLLLLGSLEAEEASFRPWPRLFA